MVVGEAVERVGGCRYLFYEWVGVLVGVKGKLLLGWVEYSWPVAWGGGNGSQLH